MSIVQDDVNILKAIGDALGEYLAENNLEISWWGQISSGVQFIAKLHDLSADGVLARHGVTSDTFNGKKYHGILYLAKQIFPEYNQSIDDPYWQIARDLIAIRAIEVLYQATSEPTR